MIKTEDYLRELVIMFFVRWKIIFAVTLLVAVCALAIALLWPPSYSSQGSILVKMKKLEKSPEVLEGNVQVRLAELSKEDLFSEVEILTSHAVISATVEELEEKNLAFDNIGESQERYQKAVGSIRDNLSTEVIPNSNIIQVQLVWKDSREVVLILKHLLGQYLVARSTVYNPTGAEVYFADQVQKYNQELKVKGDQLVALSRELGTPEPAREIENALQVKLELEQQLGILYRQLIQKQQEAEYLRKAVASDDLQFYSYIDNLSIMSLSDKLKELYVEKGVLLRTFHPQSKKVLYIQEQIDQTYAALSKEVATYGANLGNQADILQEQIAAIESRLQTLSERTINLQAQELEADMLNRDMEILRHSYDTFARRWEEAKATGGGNNLFSISIVSPPFLAGNPYFPKKGIVIPLGIIIGFIAGCSLGFLAEYFDHTFKKPEDVRRYTDLPTLYSIKKW